jgi:hypothetical protein
MPRRRKPKPITVRIDETGIYKPNDDGAFSEMPFEFEGDPRDARLWSPDHLFGLLHSAMGQAAAVGHSWFNSLTESEKTLLERTDPGTPGRPVAPPVIKDSSNVQYWSGAAEHYQRLGNTEAAMYFAFKAGMARNSGVKVGFWLWAQLGTAAGDQTMSRLLGD